MAALSGAQLAALQRADPALLEAVVWRAREHRAYRARSDINEFVEFVGRDELTGGPVTQAPVHRAFQRLCDDHSRVVIWGHVESGKAVPLDTPMPTPDGWRTMGALRVGDRVFGADGRACTVQWCSEVQHDRQVYEVAFDDGDVQRADAEHQWIAWTVDDLAAGRAPRVVTTATMAARVLRVGGGGPQYKWKVPLAGPVQYPPRVLPVHPYVLGAWLGDGNTDKPQLTFHEDDRAIYDRCVSFEGGTVPRIVRGRVMLGVIGGHTDHKQRYAPDRLTLRLRRLGVLGNKHIPVEYLTASEDQRRELLAGLLDTDGYVTRKAGNASQVEYTSVLPVLAEGVLELARSLGFKARLKVADAKLYGRVVGKRYRVFFTAREPVFFLPRKRATQAVGWLKTRARYRAVVGVTLVASVPVRCIGVDSPDHSYLMGRSYTVTHNSYQISVMRLLWKLGRNPNLRCLLLSNTQEQAKKLLRLVREYIEKSPELHAVFPHLKPGPLWSDTRITVQRTTHSKDPSITAIGMHGQIIGSRLDEVVLDDVLDFESTRGPAGREDGWQWYASSVEPRIVQGGRVVCIGNAWHPDDLMHRFANNAVVWHAARFPVLDDAGVPRWPEKWPLARIEEARLRYGAFEFARALLCLARDDAQARFRRAWIDRCLDNGDGRGMPFSLKALPLGYRTYTGVDLSTGEGKDRSVLFTIAVHPDGKREVMCVEAGRWPGPEIVRRIVDTHRRYLSIISVESNAAQKFITQFTQQTVGIPVKNFVTGANKSSPEFGIESLAVELEAGQWIIPSSGRAPLTTEVDNWIREMLHYDPAAHTGDALIASWIAREAACHRTGRVTKGRQSLQNR